MRPDLVQHLPNYPVHVQVCRVTAATVPGPAGYGSSAPGLNLYVSFTQQFQPSSLQPRDREPCLVADLNNIGLAPGYYVGRLCGSYTGLPVYEVGGASLGGSAGNITITQVTNNFIVPAPPSAMTGSSSASPGGTVLITVINTTNLYIGMQIEITDGTTTIIGYVTNIINTTSFLLQVINIVNGSPGNTIFAGATIVLCCPVSFSSVIRNSFLININSPITIQITNIHWMIPGMEIWLTDGINLIFGIIDLVFPNTNPPTATIVPIRLDTGIPGGGFNSPGLIIPGPMPDRTSVTAPFTIPNLHNPVVISATSTGRMRAGQEYVIDDGTNEVYGFVAPMTGTNFTFYPTQIINGSSGTTMLRRATITPARSTGDYAPVTSTVALTAVNISVTVNVLTTKLYKQYDYVTLADDVNLVYGYIDAILNSTSFTFVPQHYYAGSAGNVLRIYARITKCCVPVNPILGRKPVGLGDVIGFPLFPNFQGIPNGNPAVLPNGFVPIAINGIDPGVWGYLGAQWRSLTGGSTSDSIASAATTDLSTATGDYIQITGTTGISAFGTLATGIRKTLRFASSLLITHSSSLILPNSVNLTVNANDVVEVRSEGSGNWRVVGHRRATDAVVVATDGATVTFDMSAGYKHKVTLGGNRTLALSNTWDGVVFYVTLKQDGTGSRTVTWWSNILWPAGTVPTLTTTANKSDDFIFIRISSTEYHGFILGQNI